MRIRAAATDAFRRYRDHGDVAALGQVFDLTAQELLLVAAHLARRGVEAEDLVQHTFVTAIARAATWDSRRPVEPWLVGILGNLARNAQRRAQRQWRAEASIVDESMAASGEGGRDPQERAELSESAVAIRGALRAMPAAAREVLTLHLVHGMTPTEIAHAIGRPVGTVKSQVHRGLEQLRGRLPAGLATLLVVSWSRGEALAAVRIAVLATAATGGGRLVPVALPELSTASSAWGSAGAWWVGVLALPLVAVLLWPWGPVGSTPAADPNDEPTTQHPDMFAESPSAPRPADSERSPMASTALGELWIHVTVAGRGLAHAVCRLEPAHASDPRLRRREVVADGRGVAHLTGVPVASHVLGVDRGVSRPLAVRAGLQTIEIELAAAPTVVGAVVDAHGATCPGARIWLSGGESPIDGAVVTTADHAGRFEIEHVPADRFVAAFADGWLPSRAVPVAAGLAEPLTLKLDTPGTSWTASVVDAGGQAVAGALVQVGAEPATLTQRGPRECLWRPPWQGWTDAAGTTVCPCAPATGTVSVYARSAEQAGAATVVSAADPRHKETTLVLPASAGCEGRVVTGGATSPIEVVVLPVRATGPAGTVPPAWLQPRSRCDADGGYRLQGIVAGTVAVRAAASPVQFAETELQLLAGTITQWSPALGPGLPLLVQIEGLDAGSSSALEVVAASPYDTHRVPVGSDGRAVFAGLGERPFDLVLSVPEAEGSLAFARLARVHPGGVQRLAVPGAHRPDARVSGRCRTSGKRLPTMVVAVHATLGDCRAPVAADGTFALEPLPPGSWHLLLADTFHLGGMALQLEPGESRDVGEIVCSDPLVIPVTIGDGRTAAGHLHVLAEHASPLVTLCAVAAGRGELWTMPGRFVAVLSDRHGVCPGQPIELPPSDGVLRLASRDPAARLVRLSGSLASAGCEADVIWHLQCGERSVWQRTWRRDLRPGTTFGFAAWLEPGTWHGVAVDRFGERAEFTILVSATVDAADLGVQLR
ncbi:MAG: sigma-70 family RNA polymerase sigma factor [Planctomycetes bacterium]|nr:sigma-70 family RNA polymerase sigma factor [Planctomycetota bacterium]